MEHNVIEIEHLKKSYGEVKAVDDVSFCVREGEFFAFLGVNGAGKSTTISILCGKEIRDDGTVLVDGMSIDEHADSIKCRLGVVFQDSVLDLPMSVADNLRSRAALSSIVCRFLKSQGAITAVGTVVSASYGFLCGAYMPISSLTAFLSNVLMFLPGTYGTALMHEHFMGGAIDALGEKGIPAESLGRIRRGFDCTLSFFEHDVPEWVCYLVLAGTVALLVAAYVLICTLSFQKAKRKQR